VTKEREARCWPRATTIATLARAAAGKNNKKCSTIVRANDLIPRRVKTMAENSEMEKLPATEIFLWQLCKTYAQEFPDPMRPVRSELVAAFVPRAVRLLVLQYVASDVVSGIEAAVEVMPERRTAITAETTNVLQKYTHDLISQIVELDSWMHEPGVTEVECGNWLTANGYTYEQVKDLLNRAKHYQSGRRPAKRLFTVAAVEAQRLDPQLAKSCRGFLRLCQDRTRQGMQRSTAKIGCPTEVDSKEI
jgi:hypothetical protein